MSNEINHKEYLGRLAVAAHGGGVVAVVNIATKGHGPVSNAAREVIELMESAEKYSLNEAIDLVVAKGGS